MNRIDKAFIWSLIPWILTGCIAFDDPDSLKPAAGAGDDSDSEPSTISTDTAPFDLAAGQSCSGSVQCQSGHCGHGVCCVAGETCCTEENLEQCGGYPCDLAAFTCGRCAEGECAAGFHCDAGRCLPDLDAGAPCDEPSDCVDGYCAGGYCCDGAGGAQCCATSADCDGTLCNATHHCEPCDQSPQLCATEHPGRPHCDSQSGRCEECLEHIDCQEPSHAHYSPLGACAPDHTCTCKVDAPAADEAAQKQSCAADSCGPGFECVREMESVDHWACLRLCGPSDIAPALGLECAERPARDSAAQHRVWTPMTTCFAFHRFSLDCERDSDPGYPDPYKCGVGEHPDPITDDGQCNLAFLCTYSCWGAGAGNHAWCPTEHDSDGGAGGCLVDECDVP